MEEIISFSYRGRRTFSNKIGLTTKPGEIIVRKRNERCRRKPKMVNVDDVFILLSLFREINVKAAIFGGAIFRVFNKSDRVGDLDVILLQEVNEEEWKKILEKIRETFPVKSETEDEKIYNFHMQEYERITKIQLIKSYIEPKILLQRIDIDCTACLITSDLKVMITANCRDAWLTKTIIPRFDGTVNTMTSESRGRITKYLYHGMAVLLTMDGKDLPRFNFGKYFLVNVLGQYEYENQDIYFVSIEPIYNIQATYHDFCFTPRSKFLEPETHQDTLLIKDNNVLSLNEDILFRFPRMSKEEFYQLKYYHNIPQYTHVNNCLMIILNQEKMYLPLPFPNNEKQKIIFPTYESINFEIEFLDNSYWKYLNVYINGKKTECFCNELEDHVLHVNLEEDFVSLLPISRYSTPLFVKGEEFINTNLHELIRKFIESRFDENKIMDYFEYLGDVTTREIAFAEFAYLLGKKDPAKRLTQRLLFPIPPREERKDSENYIRDYFISLRKEWLQRCVIEFNLDTRFNFDNVTPIIEDESIFNLNGAEASILHGSRSYKYPGIEEICFLQFKNQEQG